jgi:hypothetical protein
MKVLSRNTIIVPNANMCMLITQKHSRSRFKTHVNLRVQWRVMQMQKQFCSWIKLILINKHVLFSRLVTINSNFRMICSLIFLLAHS